MSPEYVYQLMNPTPRKGNEMQSKEVIIKRDRIECIRNELNRLLTCDDSHQFKIILEDDQITIVAHIKPVEITL